MTRLNKVRRIASEAELKHVERAKRGKLKPNSIGVPKALWQIYGLPARDHTKLHGSELVAYKAIHRKRYY